MEGVAESSPTPIGLVEEIRAMILWSEESTREEDSLREKRGSGSRDEGAAEGANKKRKDASSISVVTPLTRERATRNQKKQSEAELEKALEESKRKDAAKGTKKAVNHVEAVEIEKMDLVLQDEEEAEEVEVVTPKAKKIMTSKKKSHSKTKFTSPSTLAKRTRSAMKFRKVKVMEEEESENDEEIDQEHDKMAKFAKRTILKDRLLRDLEKEGMIMLLEKLQLQGWKDMVL
ncbi:uncharacterized protein [Nicotiana sylvestris]|uniref:uncharacterized protein n=1 Tax=Nicotiana sylvestris TaxID=4096 RepID=UPI00388CAF70